MKQPELTLKTGAKASLGKVFMIHLHALKGIAPAHCVGSDEE
jgi:hypothetical protein